MQIRTLRLASKKLIRILFKVNALRLHIKFIKLVELILVYKTYQLLLSQKF